MNEDNKQQAHKVQQRHIRKMHAIESSLIKKKTEKKTETQTNKIEEEKI